MNKDHPDVIVVGAGISGITAARKLQSYGHVVEVIEKGRGVGGRMATRRFAGAKFDHGAQFFTSRGSDFTKLIETASEQGAVRKWTNGFSDDPDGYTRWCGSSGMTSLVKWMVAEANINVRTRTTVNDLREIPSNAYILTAPVPQCLAILSFSQMLPNPGTHIRLSSISYKPTIAILLRLDQSPSLFPEHGGIQFLDHPDLAFISDNQRKGVSDEPAITVHLSNILSDSLWENSDQEVLAATTALIRDHLSGAGITDYQIQRWRYAGPYDIWAEPTLVWGSKPIIALAGEAFAGPKVEGAFRSGLAAAEKINIALSSTAKSMEGFKNA
jgi:renalase